MRFLLSVIIATTFQLACVITNMHAQDINLLNIEKRQFEKGVKLFEEGIFHEAKITFEAITVEQEEINTAICRYCPERALFYIAECKFYLNEYDAEPYLKGLIRRHRNAPIVSSTIFNIANYYFSKEDHSRALSFYKMIDRSSITEEMKMAIEFNVGYISFIQDNYLEAREKLSQIPSGHKKSEEAIFYAAISNVELGDLKEAEAGFLSLEQSTYKKQIPYYLANIFIRTGDNNRLINYLGPIIEDGANYDNYTELLRIYGEALYDDENYNGVVKYLGMYHQVAIPPGRNPIFKLGHSYQLTGDCEKAIITLKELLDEEDDLVQQALFHLGICYLKLGNRIAARSAFLKASVREDHLELKHESLFLYATLSKEVRSYDEALNAFGMIPEYHIRYQDAVSQIADIIGDSKNYDKALQILNSIDNWNLELKEAYQKLNFHKGLSLLGENDWKAADESFSKSLQYPLDEETRILALYWKADVSHTLNKFEISNQHLEEFLIQSKKISELPIETSDVTAFYLQGYNYLKLSDFNLASAAYRRMLNTANSKGTSENPFVKGLIADATLRTGDCYLKGNNYEKAISYYNNAIDNLYKGYEHAQYYKAIILGLQGDRKSKLAMLDNFVHQHNQHELVDDALFEMGETLIADSRPEQAKSVYQELINAHGSYSTFTTTAILRLGLIYYNENDLNKALYYYRSVFENNPTKEEIGQVLNSVQEIYIQDLNNSEGYFDFVEDIPGFKLDDTGKDSLSFVAANVPYLNGKYSNAIETFDGYLERFPSGMYRVEALFKKANSYLELSKYENALQAFEMVIKAGAGPYYERSLKGASVILYESMQEFDKALSFFEKYYQSSSDDDGRHDALLYCMKSAYKSGNTTKLQEYSRKVLNNPRSNNKDRALANFFRGKEAFDQNDFTGALNHLNIVTELSDGREAAESRYLIAKMYYIKKELAIAERLCQYAVRENANYPYWIAKCMILKADIGIARDDKFKASAVLEAVIESYSTDDDGIKDEARQRLEFIKGNKSE